jgi:pimeloyl-ACP methyl ester carboxylesterase
MTMRSKIIIFIAIALIILICGLSLYSVVGAARAERDFPPLGRFVEVDGLRLHYLEQGRGRPIVLIHGASSNLRDFAASIMAPLAENHRVIAFDRPGYGYSERPSGSWPDPARQAELIHKALAQLNVTRPVLVGHSWSGSVVLAYLLDYPEQSAGGVLLAGGSHPWEGGVAWTNHLAGLPGLGPLFAATLVYPAGQFLMEQAIAEVFSPNPVTPDYAERTGVPLAMRPGQFLSTAEDVRNLSDFLDRQSRRYHEIRRPLLLITGKEDDIVPPWNHADRLIEQVPHADYVIFENTGHAPHHVHSRRIAGLIDTFAKQESINLTSSGGDG